MEETTFDSKNKHNLMEDYETSDSEDDVITVVNASADSQRDTFPKRAVFWVAPIFPCSRQMGI